MLDALLDGWEYAGAHLHKEDAKGEDVNLGGVGASEHLRGRVDKGTRRSCHARATVKELCLPHVTKLHAMPIQQHVLGRDVSMCNRRAVVMQVL